MPSPSLFPCRTSLGAKSRASATIGERVPLSALLRQANSMHSSGRALSLEAGADEASLARSVELMRQALVVYERCVGGKDGKEAYEPLKHIRCAVDVGSTLRRMGRLPEARRTFHESLEMLGAVECTLADYTTTVAPLKAEIDACVIAVDEAEASLRRRHGGGVIAAAIQRSWLARQRRAAGRRAGGDDAVGDGAGVDDAARAVVQSAVGRVLRSVLDRVLQSQQQRESRASAATAVQRVAMGQAGRRRAHGSRRRQIRRELAAARSSFSSAAVGESRRWQPCAPRPGTQWRTRRDRSPRPRCCHRTSTDSRQQTAGPKSRPVLAHSGAAPCTRRNE